MEEFEFKKKRNNKKAEKNEKSPKIYWKGWKITKKMQIQEI